MPARLLPFLSSLRPTYSSGDVTFEHRDSSWGVNIGRTNDHEELKAHFGDEEQVALTMVINVINGWNRIAVGFGGWADPAALKAQTAAAA